MEIKFTVLQQESDGRWLINEYLHDPAMPIPAGFYRIKAGYCYFFHSLNQLFEWAPWMVCELFDVD